MKLVLEKIVQGFILPRLQASMVGVKQQSMLITVLLALCVLAGWPFAYASEDSIGPGPDTDSDGLSDRFESRLGSNPLLADSDRDGLVDLVEYTGGDSGIPTNPTDKDSDNDGLADSFELSSGTDPIDRDSDRDGLSDSLELGQNTNPLAGDSDGDGVTDNIEVWHGSDALDPESFFVLPESSIGSISLVAASLAAICLYYFAGSKKA
jgi:hypothetical protein